jgi:hypothetical protein
MGGSSSGSVMMAIEVKDGKPTEEQIPIRAHEFWEQAGKPEGDRAHRRLAWRRIGLETISASA